MNKKPGLRTEDSAHSTQHTALIPIPNKSDNNFVGCVPRTNIYGAWDAPYDKFIFDLEIESFLVPQHPVLSPQSSIPKAFLRSLI